MPVVVRFAPSPTGVLHVGGARTALFNYLYARQQGGKLILRIEDTDRDRSRPEFERDIIASLNWLGLTYDEFYRQSERGEIYKKRLEQLLATGRAYWVDEEKGRAIRFKNSGQQITFRDEIRGEITFDTAELGDFVIAKSLDEPLYHFAVVVDDFELGITHIIRGEDHISNTPRQILIGEALKAPRPVYAHIPLILAPDRSKLSKRHGAVATSDYRTQGYLPEALVNYLALLGWNPGTDQEFFSLTELIKIFDLTKIQKGGAIFDLDRLKWFNREYLKKLPDEILLAKFPADLPSTIAPKLLPLIKERVSTLGEIEAMFKTGEWDWFLTSPQYSLALLQDKTHLPKLHELLSSIHEDQWQADKIKIVVWPYAQKAGKKATLWPLRVALTGQEKSPDPFTVAALIGKSETLTRLIHAQNLS